MQKSSHAHRPKLEVGVLLRGRQIVDPQGIACATCGEKVRLANLSLHKLLRDILMVAIGLVLALQKYGSSALLGSIIGLLVMGAGLLIFYWGYTLCLYLFARFLPVPEGGQ